MDPTELIARALKAKFANMRHELDSPESADSPKKKTLSDENDGEFTPPPIPVFQTPVVRRVCDGGARDALRSGPTSDATSATVAFGRHILRPVNRDKLPLTVLSDLSFDTSGSTSATQL
ncbi:unnamed protein product [Hydatigera taeniaeformis]|uniref:Uncharacterized protein n=1 Tax=Hydatigena taeniaeformis TaxID=6205 RepID=A0A3P7EUN8_HYDTA|nr:unnamed protein product [Hydatigera taeniaeformis]